MVPWVESLRRTQGLSLFLPRAHLHTEGQGRKSIVKSHRQSRPQQATGRCRQAVKAAVASSTPVEIQTSGKARAGSRESVAARNRTRHDASQESRRPAPPEASVDPAPGHGRKARRAPGDCGERAKFPPPRNGRKKNGGAWPASFEKTPPRSREEASWEMLSIIAIVGLVALVVVSVRGSVPACHKQRPTRIYVLRERTSSGTVPCAAAPRQKPRRKIRSPDPGSVSSPRAASRP